MKCNSTSLVCSPSLSLSVGPLSLWISVSTKGTEAGRESVSGTETISCDSDGMRLLHPEGYTTVFVRLSVCVRVCVCVCVCVCVYVCASAR